MTAIQAATVPDPVENLPATWRDYYAEQVWQRRPAYHRAVMIWQLVRDTEKGLEAYRSGGRGILKGLKHSLRGRAAALLQVGTKGWYGVSGVLLYPPVTILKPVCDLGTLARHGRDDYRRVRQYRSAEHQARVRVLAQKVYELAVVTGSVILLEPLNYEQSAAMRGNQYLNTRSNEAVAWKNHLKAELRKHQAKVD